MERYLTLSGIHDFVQQVARYGSVIPHGSVHLDARMISPRCGMKCGGFWACFLRQSGVAGWVSLIDNFFVIRHNFEELGDWSSPRIAHGTLFTISGVACILMHEWLPSREFFIRATSCTLRGGIMLLFCGFEVDDINGVCADKKFNDVFSVQ